MMKKVNWGENIWKRGHKLMNNDWCKMMWNNMVMWYDLYNENIYKTKIEINVGQSTDPKITKIWIILNIIYLHFKVVCTP